MRIIIMIGVDEVNIGNLRRPLVNDLLTKQYLGKMPCAHLVQATNH